jgi:hypothetical protein
MAQFWTVIFSLSWPSWTDEDCIYAEALNCQQRNLPPSIGSLSVGIFFLTFVVPFLNFQAIQLNLFLLISYLFLGL